VCFVPTTSWQIASWAAARSTRYGRPVGQAAPSEAEPFPLSYSTRSYSPVLWYTPDAALGDEVYDFLHRLPGIGRIVVLCEGQGLRELDKSNLTAMLEDSFDLGRSSPFTAKEDVRLLTLQMSKPARREGRIGYWESARTWLNLEKKLSANEPRTPYRFSRIIIVVPATPYFACALIPLAAYLQATLVFMDPQHSNDSELIGELVGSAFSSDADRVDEIWLVGQAERMHAKLTAAMSGARKQQDRFDIRVAVRGIPCADHFAAAEQASVILLTYQHLDWLLLGAFTHSDRREFCFPFLSSLGTSGLFHYCNRALDLADQIQQGNFAAVTDVHDLYWSMHDEERRDFIQRFRAHPEHSGVIANSLAVIADYASEGGDNGVPHYLIDAAAFAARRAAPLLLLQRLPTETSYYIGSLMDKIDDKLNDINRLQIELYKENSKLQPPTQFARAHEGGDGGGAAADESADLAEADQRWRAAKQRIEDLRKQVPNLKSNLRHYIKKTGEVLYESLVPLAIRNALHQLNPNFLAVFIQDPSLPVELICESDWAGSRPVGPSQQSEASQADHGLTRFWGLRYAIGHMSSVNFYETNLTSNISLFAPPSEINVNDIRVLLCSNPTRDLFFSGQEADKIASHFQQIAGGRDSDPGEEADSGKIALKQLDRLTLGSQKLEWKPTRNSFIAALRRGYDIVHYSGHAFFDNVLPGRSGLVLSDDVLTASDVRFMLDFTRSPIIYANACLAGRIKSVSSRFTGLAAAFLRAGAAGYVSPLWSIDDRDAAALAMAYYEALLTQRLPIGECLRVAKLAQAKSRSITWASYVLYGDPTLRIIGSANHP
jgi:hypothetical protein